MDLILRTANGDFDLFGSEDIVQTLGIFSFNDITARSGEYTPIFDLPLTNNNRKLIEYADFIPSINTSPYKKIEITLIVGGIEFKTGFLVIDSISDVIKTRFFSGNSNFYDSLKSIYLTDLDWSSLDHVWNYTNAVASSANTSGYTYPVMDYSGQNLASDTVDIRKILPCTFVKTAINKTFLHLGYTYVDDFDTTDLVKAVMPYSKKNPTVSTEIQLLNQVDLGLSINTSASVYSTLSPYKTVLYNNTFIPQIFSTISDVFTVTPGSSQGYNLNEVTMNVDYDTINTAGSSTNYDFLTRRFTAGYSGTYDYNQVLNLADYDYMNFSFNYNIANFTANTSTVFNVYRVTPTSTTLINSVISNTGYLITTAIGSYPAIPAITQTFLTDTIAGSVYLDSGDELIFKVSVKFNIRCGVLVNKTTATATFNPIVLSTSKLEIDLKPELVFGGVITYASILPKIKCSDFLRDVFIRFGLLIDVNEDTKVVTVSKLDKLTENIPNAVNWTNKLDESNLPDQSFKFDNYAQNNLFKHKEDNSILKINPDSDYNLTISNANLELSKDFYTSPFSQSENVDFNGVTTTYINLYDTNTSKFDNEVNYRICFFEPVVGLFKFTDGTTTSGFINTNRIYFIDYTLPELSMGFGIGLMPKNSQTLISTLQNIRIVKANFNLNINDIKSIDWLTPVYIDQFQSYFFITSINQFNYTNPDLTEVELIKLNQ